MSGKCINCGKCCAGILLITNEEEARIKKYISENNIVPTNYQSVLQDYIDKCPFLDKDTHLCKIYEVRPDICRNFKCYGDTEVLDIHKVDDMKIANMLTTFYPKSYCPKVDLSYYEDSLEKIKNNVKRGR